MMVELMQPTLKDEICDPAMGSAGFIVESVKYIAEHYKQELLKKENADHCGRSGITDLKISDEITNREYQKRAIRAICENFNTMHRRRLLVMATGTGKTLVAISLCDVLMRNGWTKNILFLADRTALVKQAHKNFTKLLPSATTARLDDFKPADKESVMKARILFSTYQTMINYIDTELKEFSIGRFDLIVIDEVHRSIFGKYTSILSYFDALMVGLTATPREDDDRSTYELFERESGEPNFEYLLEEAVSDGYLVDKQVLPRTTDILKNGIKYDKLTEEEKQQMESIWKYEKAKLNIPDDELYRRNIEHEELFSYIFNENTIDKVIIDLMENGLKINGGDTIGKTIIFAYNHNHAVLIVDRFKQLYPALGDDFCQLIDNTVNYAQSLIDTFEVRGKMPQIAVSVDMLDTGVDVPDILNLVFFKQVRSKIKFLQMIGRGTRLSEEIFDEGETPEDRAKKFFYIFDWCGNFEFFGENPRGYEPLKSISLTQRLFDLCVDLAIALRHEQYQNDEVAKALHDEVKAILMGQVKELNDKHISVREHWDMVDKYRRKETWVYLSNTDGIELKDVIAPLLVNGTMNMGATKFDILMLNIELSQIDEAVSCDKSKLVVEKIANKLQEKASIKQVNDKMPLIKQLSKHEFWESMSQASSQPTMKVATPSKRSKKAQEVRFIPSGSILTNILDDNEVRKLIHNMMELEDGTTIDTIYLECQREFQERYFSMTGNEWRHLVRDYVREVTQQPNLQEKEVFRFSMAV